MSSWDIKPNAKSKKVFTRDNIYAIARICYRPSVCLSVCQTGVS